MKAILISIKPRYVANILDGKKTLEIRKTLPKYDLPIPVYIYCTKEKPYITKIPVGYFVTSNPNRVSLLGSLNGNIVAKFMLNKVDIINEQSDTIDLMLKARLTLGELTKYLGDKVGYAWHIDNLEIFDKPKKLKEFYSTTTKIGMNMNGHNCVGYIGIPLTKAPQSWQFIEVKDND